MSPRRSLRTTRSAASVALAVVLVAGCSDDAPPDGATTEPPTALPTGEETETEVPDEPALPGEPERVEPQEGLEAVEPHPWDEVFVLDQGRGVELRWTSAPCRLLDRIEVDYSGDAVTLTLFLGQEDADAPCDGSAVYRARRRTLPEPVGDRGLVDGAEL